ncbi:hypothetical protein [Dendronalium sp. ChiSLP03b]|uniref:hypothetical protein n=1 Tax=Dendronalium sp. ChiSLP03b TaxID=3075381 RepID=UPI002AD324BC|nr:hypothetical protein [Dendronalium sp. ChiSLP03b]MDZ8204632.1 hypothetical protein [Dendronalium sp. ChiSLP03b]
MTNWLAKLTMISLKPRFGQKNPLEEQLTEDKVPIFTNVKSLTFPGLVLLVKGAWLSLQQLPISWANSKWIPFLFCILFGLVIAISNLKEEKPSPRYDQWFLGILIALFNSLVIFGAVVGVPTPK